MRSHFFDADKNTVHLCPILSIFVRSGDMYRYFAGSSIKKRGHIEIEIGIES